MSRVIYYFTGTGNSLKVARDLAKELGSTQLVPIASVMDKDTIHVSADQAGIVCPVYMWGLPLIVVHFVSRLVVTGAPYLFGIVTFGGLQGATPALIGLAMGMFGLSQGLMQIPYGLWSDRVGRKKPFIVGMLIFTCGLILASFTDSIYLLIIARTLQGGGAVAAVIFSWIGDAVPRKKETVPCPFRQWQSA